MGIQINGQTDTVTAIDGSITVGTDLTVPGVLTYDDVTNIDSIGVITARSGLKVTSGGINVTGGNVGIGTDESYGDGNASFSSLSLGGNGTRFGLLEINKSDGTAGSWIDCYGTGGNGDLRITTAGTSGKITFWTGGEFTEKVTIASDGKVGIGTTNPTSTKLTVRQDSGELARFQVNTQTSSGTITCIGGTASYSGINFGDSDNVDAGRIRHYNDDNSTAVDSFLFYTNDTERIALNKYGLLTNYPGSNSEVSGGTILGRYKYTQQNQSQNYEHLILGPDGRKLQDIVDTNCFAIITVCVTGTGTNGMFCQYHYVVNQTPGAVTLTNIAGNDSSSSNRPYMVLANTYDPAWKMNHSGGYVQDIEVAIYGGNDQYTYTTQFGNFGANP